MFFDPPASNRNSEVLQRIVIKKEKQYSFNISNAGSITVFLLRVGFDKMVLSHRCRRGNVTSDPACPWPGCGSRRDLQRPLAEGGRRVEEEKRGL